MTTQSKNTRRTFFAGLGAIAAAGAAVKLSQPAVAVAEAAPQAEPAEGYRLTDHIKKYYRTTTI